MNDQDPDLETVVFPLPVRAGQRFVTPHGEVVVGKYRETKLSRKLYDHFLETHGASYFKHDQQHPTDHELFANDRGPRAKLPRPGTKAWELYAAEHEQEGRQVAAAVNAAHNRAKRGRPAPPAEDPQD